MQFTHIAASTTRARLVISPALAALLVVSCLAPRRVAAREGPATERPLPAPPEIFAPRASRPPVDYSRVPAHEERHDGVGASAGDLSRGAGEPRDGRLRVVFLGNTLVQRDTQFGYLETELTRLLPDVDVSFRNLGWPGDTVDGAARVEFGPGEEQRRAWQRPDSPVGDYGFRKMLGQLKRERPDVLFVAYGSNAAFSDEQGLATFRAGLSRLLDTLEPTGTQVVLVSPPPRELRAGFSGPLAEQNRRLARVAEHLGQVAKRRQLVFIDLFHAWPDSLEGFTDNGIHLNQLGYQRLAAIVADALLPERRRDWKIRIRSDGSVVETVLARSSAARSTEYGMRWRVTDTFLPSSARAVHSPRRLVIEGLEPGTYTLDIDGQRVARGTADEWARGVAIERGPDFQQVEELRGKILQKNRLYFYGFRPENKAYIYLFRRHERGQHAAEVERFALLVERAEDEIARLRLPLPRIYELAREDDYPDHEVPGETPSPDIETELAAFRVPDGFEISLFASDPMISKPININWDERGRAWVATSTIYPHLAPGQSPVDRILIVEDIDGDGRADKSTVFADGLLVPQSVLPGHGGVYVTQSTDLLFLRDTDGDDRADERRVVFTGFGNADVHHMIHGLRWGPGGDLYFLQSIYINSIVETPWGLRTSGGSCVWRLRAETLRLEMFCQGLVNPWGFAFDTWGQSFATDGAGGSGIGYLFPGSAYITHGYAGRELQALNPGRPKECGLEVLSGRHLPSDWRSTLITADFRANKLTRYRLTEKGSGYASEFLGEMVTSSHRGFRPVDIKMGPDGAIYIVDWYNLIIDHGEVDFHHPLRDKQHGRIWRLRAKEAPLVEPPRLGDAGVPALLGALEAPEQWTREQARRLLRERDSASVLPELQRWLADPSRSDLDRLEGLWVTQGLRATDRELLLTCLRSADHRVRAAAVRVLSDWHDELPDAGALFERAVTDSNAQVRLEAVNALRQVGTQHAVELALRALDQPTDTWLDFALFRTAHELRDVWLPDFESGRVLFQGDPRRIAFALSAAGSEASLAPLAALIRDRQVRGAQQIDALAVLATSGNAAQRALVLDRLPQLSVGGIRHVLAALVQSSRDRRPASAASIEPLFDAGDETVRRLAMSLAGRWTLTSAFDRLRERARDEAVADEERFAAARALMAIDPGQAMVELKGIYEAASTDNVRATSVAAWAQGSAGIAARHAVKLFASGLDEGSIAILTDAFLTQKEGARHLTAALEGVRIPGEAARAIIDRVRLSGQEMRELVAALRAAGDLEPLAQLTREEIVGILRDVPIRGDAQRGEAVFRQERLQCGVCHSVGGQGGRVGPDLSSLGGSARVSDILQSVIDPSATIKEGFQTVHVVTVDGTIVSGILQQQTAAHVSVRDAKDQLQTISTDDVVEIESSTISVMPTGLTEVLSRHELVDLVRYLSSLGRETEAGSSTGE